VLLGPPHPSPGPCIGCPRGYPCARATALNDGLGIAWRIGALRHRLTRYGRRPLPPSADRRPHRCFLPPLRRRERRTKLARWSEVGSPARGRSEPPRNADHPATQILPSSSPQSGRSQRPLSLCARRTLSATAEGRTAGPGLASFYSPPPGKDWARPGYARYLTYRDERGTIPQSGEEGR
jgi:hypothetical protein